MRRKDRYALLVLMAAATVHLRVCAGASTFWRDLTPSSSRIGPRARQGGAAAYCAGMDAALFVGGLVERQGPIMDAWVFNTTLKTWIAVDAAADSQPVPPGRFGHSLTTLRGDANDKCAVLLLGGEDQSAAAFVGVLERSGESALQIRWHAFTPTAAVDEAGTPGSRAFHAAVRGDNETVYLLGGNRECNADQDGVWRLRISLPRQIGPGYVPSGSWELVETTGDAPPCLWMLSGTRLDASTLGFFGGNSMQSGPVSDRVRTRKALYVLSLKDKHWTQPPQRTSGDAFQRYGHAAAALDGSLFVHGGARYHFQTDAPQSPFFLLYFNSLLQTRPQDARAPQQRCRGGAFSAEHGSSGTELFCEPREMAGDSSVGPECRALHLAVQRRDSLLLFGGLSDPSCARSRVALSDVWEANLTLALRGGFVEARDADQSDAALIINAVFYLFGVLLISAAGAAWRVMRRRRRGSRMRQAMQRRGSSSAGMSRAAIRRLPVAKFRDVAALGSDRGETACPICLGDYGLEDALVVLPCGHVFHPECAECWLVKSDLCPLCKVSVCARPHATEDDYDDDDAAVAVV